MTFPPKESTVILGSFQHTPSIRIFGNTTIREKLLHQVRTATITSPSFCCSIGSFTNISHFIIKGRSHQEKRCTPTGCCITILQQRKDCFNLCSIFTVISHEKHLIGTPLTFTRLMQRITRFHYFVSVFSRLFPLCRTSINFGIQIKARKQHPTGSLVSPAISIAFRGFHRSNAAIFSNQFTFNKIIYLFASSLRSSIRRNLSQERNISKTVHQMKIIKRTEKTNFSSHSCIIFSSFSQIEVAHCHSKIKAIIKTFQHRMTGSPLIEVKCGNTFIPPVTYGLISSQFISIKHLADKTGRTTIQTINITITIGTTITSQRHVSIAFCEQCIIIRSHIRTGVNRRNVQVVHARAQP